MAKVTFITRDAGNFDTRTLRALMEGSNALAIEAWGACGMFYRPFLNGRFGPPQISHDADIAVRTVADAVALDAWLHQHHGWRRWAVYAAGPDGDFPYGPHCLRMRLGAVRMVDVVGRIEVLAHSQQVLDDLRDGLVALEGANKHAFNGDADFMAQAVGRARKLLREYPGLRLNGRLAQAYAAQFGKHKPTAALGAFTIDLHKAVVKAEACAVKSTAPVVWKGLTESELSEAREVVNHYRTADRRSQAVPVTAPAALPAPLQAQADAKRFAEVSRLPEPEIVDLPAPEGFVSWLHFVCTQVDDATFREWLSNQIRARKPYGGRDTYLPAMLSGNLYKGRTGVKHDGEQKVTHGGWQLDQHLASSAQQLATDGLFTELRTRGWSLESAQQVRAAMRLAMLHHDIGKLVSVNKPGAHGGASVALWNDTAPEWVDETTKKLAAFCMMGHDYFGRLARAITEKVNVALDDNEFNLNAPTSYRGAMCPQKIADIIARYGTPDWRVYARILRLVWEADAGSVQTLRWVLPVADPIERILLKRLAAESAG